MLVMMYRYTLSGNPIDECGCGSCRDNKICLTAFCQRCFGVGLFSSIIIVLAWSLKELSAYKDILDKLMTLELGV